MRPISKSHRIMLATALLLALVSLASQQIAQAMFMVGNDTPIDRLVANINAYLKNRPKDSRAFYLLGRVHALAYATKSGTVRVYDQDAKEGKLPVLDENHISMPVPADTAPVSKEVLRKYLVEAVKHYHAAIRLEPKTPLYYHSLASSLETAGEDLLFADVIPLFTNGDNDSSASTLKKDEEIRKSESWWSEMEILRKAGVPAVDTLKRLMGPETTNPALVEQAKEILQQIWREEIIQNYWMAYTLALRKDMRERGNYVLDKPIAQQASEAYLRLVNQRGPSELERERIKQIQHDLTGLSNRGLAMTPIIFHDTAPRPLADLLSDRYVTFDINGDDIPDRCPWLKPDTALLVWDPNQTGQITSGRQLFGSVTWWIFWKDGYEALKALDDNQDGELAGKELKGLALWKDKNQNGISEENEVQPIEETEIQSLSTESTQSTTPGPSPANPQGLKLKNGRVLPTYDWTFTL